MGNINFVDIIKKSFLSLGSLNETTLLGIIVAMLAAFVMGLFIFFIYKACYRGVVYSHSFNVSLMLMVLITAMIIMTISSNIVLSLGMVGALSIVRFRTAVKDPMDLVFLFWAVAGGVSVGARMYSIAIAGSILIALAFLILSKMSKKDQVYLLVINYENPAGTEIIGIMNRLKYITRSKMTTNNNTEMTIELKLKDNNTSFVNIISEIKGVNNVALVSYNGDYAQ